jgi:hypothetical protein
MKLRRTQQLPLIEAPVHLPVHRDYIDLARISHERRCAKPSVRANIAEMRADGPKTRTDIPVLRLEDES